MHFFILRNKYFAKGLQRGDTQGLEDPSVWVDCPMKCFLNVFPFKVVFHVQTAMHAIAKYCSSVSKKETIIWINSCYICCPSASLFFGLFFIMWLFPSSHFPSRHLSPCQHGEAHCRQYPCLWIHIDDALLLSCDSPPLLTTLGFSLQPRWEDGLSVMLIVFCALRESSVCLWQISVGCQVKSASMNEKEVCRCYHEQLKNIHSTTRKHLHLLFSEWDMLFFWRITQPANTTTFQLESLAYIKFKIFLIFGVFSSETNSASLFKCCIFSKTILTVLLYIMRYINRLFQGLCNTLLFIGQRLFGSIWAI